MRQPTISQKTLPVRSVQRPLNLSIASRTVLVTLDTIRAVLGVDAETIEAKVQAVEIRWVWNVATGDDIRELRFWAKEFTAPDLCRISPAQAIAEILGERRELFRGTEIAQLLLVSRPTVMRLVESDELSGEVIGGVIKVSRAALQKFLMKRLELKS